MRFNVIGSYSTAEQERKYNEVAERIANHGLNKLGPSLQALRSIYPRLDPEVCRTCTARTFVECAARAAEQAPGADAARTDC